LVSSGQIVDIDEIIQVARILHDMRSNSGRPEDSRAGKQAEPTSVEAILTEVNGWVGELRCHSMGQLVQSNVSMGQLHVLWLLQHHGSMPMSRLAELVGVSLSNATGIIDRMEEHGLVERVRVPNDRRLVLVRPAAAGVRALTETETHRRERLRSVLSHLSATERPIVLAALRSLRRALSEVEASAVHQHHFADAN
jgi:MarR family transcriptional regulator, organic hydroperoxide resistance regulator